MTISARDVEVAVQDWTSPQKPGKGGKKRTVKQNLSSDNQACHMNSLWEPTDLSPDPTLRGRNEIKSPPLGPSATDNETPELKHLCELWDDNSNSTHSTDVNQVYDNENNKDLQYLHLASRWKGQGLNKGQTWTTTKIFHKFLEGMNICPLPEILPNSHDMGSNPDSGPCLLLPAAAAAAAANPERQRDDSSEWVPVTHV